MNLTINFTKEQAIDYLHFTNSYSFGFKKSVLSGRPYWLATLAETITLAAFNRFFIPVVMFSIVDCRLYWAWCQGKILLQDGNDSLEDSISNYLQSPPHFSIPYFLYLYLVEFHFWGIGLLTFLKAS